MGDCLRRACPCLEALWRRLLGDKTASPGEDSTGTGPEQRAASPPPPERGSIYTAIWDFESRHADELSFREGDLFSVISRSGDWWSARRIDTCGRVLGTGNVPSNYMARAESLETQP